MRESFFIQKEINGILLTCFFPYTVNIDNIERGWEKIVDQVSKKNISLFKNYSQILEIDGFPISLVKLEQEKKIYLLSPHMRIETQFLMAFSEGKISREDYPPAAYQELQKILKMLNEKRNLFNNISYFRKELMIYDYPNLFGDKFSKILEETAHDFSKLISLVKKMRPSPVEFVTDYGFLFLTKMPSLRDTLMNYLVLWPYLKENSDRKTYLIKTFIDLKNKKDNGAVLNFLLPFIILKIRILPSFILSFIIQKSLEFSATRFVAGTSIEGAKKSLDSLKITGRDSSLDQLGELVVTNEMADHYTDQVIKILEDQSKCFALGEVNSIQLPKVEVSIKVTALSPYFDFYKEFNDIYKEVAPRLKKILIKAKDLKAFINVDAEHYPYRDTVFEILKKCILEEEELKNYPHIGIVLQAYLKDSHLHFNDLLKFAKLRNITFPIRLVKGAYFDSEVREQTKKGLDALQYINKEESDLNFRLMMYFILENSPHVRLRVASHNFADHAYSESLRKNLFFKALPIEHQCLHMTCDPLSKAIVEMGWAQRDYVPLGEMVEGMGYLTRRILENSSQVGFLNMLREQKMLKELTPPERIIEEKERENKLELELSLKSYADEKISFPFYKTPQKISEQIKEEKLSYNKLSFYSISFIFEKNLFVLSLLKKKSLIVDAIMKGYNLNFDQSSVVFHKMVDSLFQNKANPSFKNINHEGIEFFLDDLVLPHHLIKSLIYEISVNRVALSTHKGQLEPLLLLINNSLFESFPNEEFIDVEGMEDKYTKYKFERESKFLVFNKTESATDIISTIVRNVTELGGKDFLMIPGVIFLHVDICPQVLDGLRAFFKGIKGIPSPGLNIIQDFNEIASHLILNGDNQLYFVEFSDLEKVEQYTKKIS